MAVTLDTAIGLPNGGREHRAAISPDLADEPADGLARPQHARP
jgi:hypothetical protein